MKNINKLTFLELILNMKVQHRVMIVLVYKIRPRYRDTVHSTLCDILRRNAVFFSFIRYNMEVKQVKSQKVHTKNFETICLVGIYTNRSGGYEIDLHNFFHWFSFARKLRNEICVLYYLAPKRYIDITLFLRKWILNFNRLQLHILSFSWHGELEQWRTQAPHWRLFQIRAKEHNEISDFFFWKNVPDRLFYAKNSLISN